MGFELQGCHCQKLLALVADVLAIMPVAKFLHFINFHVLVCRVAEELQLARALGEPNL